MLKLLKYYNLNKDERALITLTSDRCDAIFVSVELWKPHTQFGVLYLEFVKLVFLGWEVMKATTAFLHYNLRLVQPILQWLHTGLKISHLCLQVLPQNTHYWLIWGNITNFIDNVSQQIIYDTVHMYSIIVKIWQNKIFRNRVISWGVSFKKNYTCKAVSRWCRFVISVFQSSRALLTLARTAFTRSLGAMLISRSPLAASAFSLPCPCSLSLKKSCTSP